MQFDQEKFSLTYQGTRTWNFTDQKGIHQQGERIDTHPLYEGNKIKFSLENVQQVLTTDTHTTIFLTEQQSKSIKENIDSVIHRLALKFCEDNNYFPEYTEFYKGIVTRGNLFDFIKIKRPETEPTVKMTIQVDRVRFTRNGIFVDCSLVE
jgi:UDP-galactopyranose mutase